jgi:hypothetical protein
VGEAAMILSSGGFYDHGYRRISFYSRQRIFISIPMTPNEEMIAQLYAGKSCTSNVRFRNDGA